jgi:hypothetical protein
MPRLASRPEPSAGAGPATRFITVFGCTWSPVKHVSSELIAPDARDADDTTRTPVAGGGRPVLPRPLPGHMEPGSPSTRGEPTSHEPVLRRDREGRTAAERGDSSNQL